MAFDDGKIADLLLRPMANNGVSLPQIIGKIVRLVDGKLYFSTEQPLKLTHKARYTVIFLQNQITYEMKRYALAIIHRAIR